MDSQHTPVVIGAGIAGLLTALHLAPMRCLLLTSGTITGSELCASSLAQGGIAAAIAPGDSPQSHAHDTIAAGAGLSDPRVVERVCAKAPDVIETLRRFGVNFDQMESGELRLGLEGGHSARRIIHASDHTGAEIMRALRIAVEYSEHITVWDNTTVTDINAPTGRVESLTINRADKHMVIPATRVVLATGGLGGLFRHTTNPPGARGQGIALAARAGARITDLEFVQFHPTALDVGGHQLPLVSEAVRGEGVPLIDSAGLPILDDALSTRDIVARAVWRAGEEGREVFLATQQCRTRFSQRFPTIASRCRESGIDPDVEPIPVRVAAHYSMGGIDVDASGRSSVDGLWACGEVARTGLHGGNRLASNSLLEAGAYAHWIAQDIQATAPSKSRATPSNKTTSVNELHPSRAADTPASLKRVQEIVSSALGVEREESRLREAIDQLEPLEKTDAGLVAMLMARAALARTESVGAHWRSDAHISSQPVKHLEWSA